MYLYFTLKVLFCFFAFYFIICLLFTFTFDLQEKITFISDIESRSSTWRYEREELLRQISSLQELNAYGAVIQERCRQALVRIILLTVENERLRASSGQSEIIMQLRSEVELKTQRLI